MGKIIPGLSHFINLGNKTSEYSDEWIVEGIMNNSNQALEYVYKQYYSKIERMVWTFRNTILIPEDVFQEGLTRVVINIQNGKFRGDSSFHTYLNSVCRNVCLKELSKHRHAEINENLELEDEFEDFERLDALLVVVKRLDKNCQDIIEMRFNLNESYEELESDDLNKTIPFEQIADKLKLTAANARQRFKRCLDKLRELVMNDQDLKEFYT